MRSDCLIDAPQHGLGGPRGELTIKRLSDAAERPELWLYNATSPPPPRSRGHTGVAENRSHLKRCRLGSVLNLYDLRIDNHARMVCTRALSVKQCVHA